jgi:hypothetical protein
MVELKNLLDRFNNLLFSNEAKTEAIKKAVFEATGIEIKKEEVRIKNSTIFLNIKPLYKNEIFLKQEKILSILKELLPKNPPGAIR